MTVLEIINQVLRRLREPAAEAQTTDSYHMMIAGFLADIHNEVNERTMWTALDHSEVLTITAGEDVYDIPNTTDRSQILYDAGERAQAWLYRDATAPFGMCMIQQDPTWVEGRHNIDTNLTNTLPMHFAVYPKDDFTGLQLRLWPTPSEDRVMIIRLNTPEADIEPDTDLNRTIRLPARVLRLGTLWLTLMERGEDLSVPGGPIHARYVDALNSAVEDEIARRERFGFYDWSK